MDLFKFTGTPPENLEGGQMINGYDSAVWVERYREPGEFTIKAPLSSGLNLFLPRGTMISHMRTLEWAVVEDHQILEEKDKDPQLVITGRSFDAWLQHRVVGVNEAYGTPAAPYSDYVLSVAWTWAQAELLINEHIDSFYTVDNNDSLTGVYGVSSVSGSGTAEARTVKRGTVHERLMEILKVDDLGIRTLRKNPFGVLGNPSASWLMIHRGNDRCDEIIFSWDAGHLDASEYLWSTRRNKNVALVQGRWTEVIVYAPGSDFNFNRRTMLVDASDLDQTYSDPPTGQDLIDIRAAMTVRGEEALAGNNEVQIAGLEVSTAHPYSYRVDYDIGDIVSLDGNYGDIEKRRVVEHVEIEDETGEVGHPTLEVIP